MAPNLKLLKDFFYLPMNRRHRQGIGYAFINFQAEGTAKLFKEAGGSDRRLDGWNFLIRKEVYQVHTQMLSLCHSIFLLSFVVNWLPQRVPKRKTTQLFWIIKKLNFPSNQCFSLLDLLFNQGKGDDFSSVPFHCCGFWMVVDIYPASVSRRCAAINSRDGTVRRWFTWRLHNSKVVKRWDGPQMSQTFVFSKNSNQGFGLVFFSVILGDFSKKL